MNLVEVIFGRSVPEGVLIGLAYIGLIVTLVWMGRLVAADVFWMTA